MRAGVRRHASGLNHGVGMAAAAAFGMHTVVVQLLLQATGCLKQLLGRLGSMSSSAVSTGARAIEHMAVYGQQHEGSCRRLRKFSPAAGPPL